MESGAVAGYYIDNNKVTHGFLLAPVRQRNKCWLDRRSWVWELQERHGRSFREGEHRPHVVPANVLAVSDHPSHLVSVGQADFVTSVGGKCIHPSLRPRRFLQSFGALRTPELAEYSILCPQTGIRPRQGQPDCNRLGPLKQRRFQRRFDSITYPRTPVRLSSCMYSSQPGAFARLCPTTQKQDLGRLPREPQYSSQNSTQGAILAAYV
jgi:hypothetical protein